MAILVTAEPDVADGHASVSRELRRDPAGVGAALLDDEQAVIAGPLRLEAENLVDDEVLRLAADRTRGRRPAVRARRNAEAGNGARIAQLPSCPFWCALSPCASSTMAWQARPSPRPSAPSSSVVVALTLMQSIRTPRSSAMFCRMSRR